MQALLNSPTAARWALWLCRVSPPRLGYCLADYIALRVAGSSTTPVVQAIKANQWVVSGESLSPQQLDWVALECWRHVTRSFFELFHNFDTPEALIDRVIITPMAEEMLAASQEKKRGMIVCGLHLSGFDLVAQAAALKGFKAVALSLPQADDAIEWQHKLRRKSGMEILPVSLSNLRHVIQRVESGETLLTGIDRPMPGLKHCLNFFGRPARLPTHHITLALKTGAPIRVMVPVYMPDGRYMVYSSEEIYLRPYSDRETEITANGERVLEAAQDLIQMAPAQWAVFHPVWPYAIDKLFSCQEG